MPAASPSDAARDARWLAHRYDPEADAFHFLPVSRDEHRAATFLIDDLLPAGREPLMVRRAEAMASPPPRAPIHFIFHSAYCCSTLLARAFDQPGWAMGLKEPVVLNDITGWRRRGGKGPDMANVLSDAVALLARPFEPDEAVIVKPSTAANALAPATLALRPEARALLLHAPLEAYVTSIARKGLDGRLWVRTLLLGMIDDRLPTFGFGPRDHLALTDLQVAAIGWLGQQALFADMVERFGAARVRTLDSATLMRDPGRAMEAIANLFALPFDNARRDAILRGPAFTRHSKLDTAFDAGDRAAAHEAGAGLHADEIGKVIVWARKLAETMGVSIDAPAPIVSAR